MAKYFLCLVVILLALGWSSAAPTTAMDTIMTEFWFLNEEISRLTSEIGAIGGNMIENFDVVKTQSQTLLQNFTEKLDAVRGEVAENNENMNKEAKKMMASATARTSTQMRGLKEDIAKLRGQNTDLRDQNIALKVDISTNGVQMKKMMCMLQQLVPEYRFELTQTKGTWKETRRMCHELGGDLISDTFGPKGSKYHKEIQRLKLPKYLWVGLSDEGEEGIWRYTNGELHDQGADNVFSWKSGQPKNNVDHAQNCAYVSSLSKNKMYDDACDATRPRGLCEIRVNNYCD